MTTESILFYTELCSGEERMNNKIIVEYVSSTSKRKTEYYLFNRIFVYINDLLPDFIDVQSLIFKLEKLPEFFFDNIDDIFIGQFDVLKKKGVSAIYLEGAIYISNEQKSNEQLLRDVVHELGHSLEETFSFEIYGSGKLESEFLHKRKLLRNLLCQTKDSISPSLDFMNSSYVKDFDIFLYKKIGYERLLNMTNTFFLSPYSITSVREYFAVGFEEYFLNFGKRSKLRHMCPILYQIFENLETLGLEDSETNY